MPMRRARVIIGMKFKSQGAITRRLLRSRFEIAGITLILYAVIAVRGELLLDKSDELLPFFDWSLFSHPERIRTHYWVYIADPDGAGGISEIAPVEYRDPVRFNKAVGTMGNVFARLGVDHSAFQEQRRSVETHLRELNVTNYVLVRRSYDVMAYYRNRAILKLEPLAWLTIANDPD